MKYDTTLFPSVLADITAYADKHFDGARRWNVKQIAQYMGKTRQWCYSTYGVTVHGGWTIFELARRLSY
ncbi:MAG TPA: hypothetical protein PKN39_06380 [Oscillospiraceae bacterium]|nr:hypothetical protein [Oscillospiraceae bacterium]